jgi:hypothetical protein
MMHICNITIQHGSGRVFGVYVNNHVVVNLKSLRVPVTMFGSIG